MPLELQKSSRQLDETIPFLLFRIRQHLCALPLEYVVETMRPLPLNAIAGVPAAVQGLAIIRGEPVPVVDPGVLLGGEAAASTRFISVRTGTNYVALAVESVVGLRHLAFDTLREIPLLLSAANDQAVAAIGTLDAELLMVLDTAHLVPESLWQEINASGGTP